jgi:hypothetical protein
MHRGKLITVVGCSALIVALVSPVLAASRRELPILPERSARHDVTPRRNGPWPLQRGTYGAKLFPLAVRVTVPAGWRGGQGQSRQFGQRSPGFGWIVLSQGAVSKEQGAISIVAGYGPTSPVGAVVAGLRNRGHGASYEPTMPVTIGGSPGTQFDGRVDGATHVFIPFSAPQHVATFYADAFTFDRGQAFRILALNVRGKTVVVFIESGALPAQRFPAFLASAGQILESLRFPA